MRPEQVEHLLSVVIVSAPDTLKETFPAPAKLLQGIICFAYGALTSLTISCCTKSRQWANAQYCARNYKVQLLRTWTCTCSCLTRGRCGSVLGDHCQIQPTPLSPCSTKGSEDLDKHGNCLHPRHDSSSKIVPTATHAYMHTCTRTCTTSTKRHGNSVLKTIQPI